MAYGFVQSKDSAASGVLPTLTVGAGNKLLVVSMASGNIGTPTIADTAGNTWIYVGGVTGSTNSYHFWYVDSAKAGATVITVTPVAGKAQSQTTVQEFSGLGALQNSAGLYISAGGGTINGLVSTAISVTSQPAMLWGACLNRAQTQKPTAGTSPIAFTGRATTLSWSAYEDARRTATGSVSATFGSASSSSFWIWTAAFSEAAAGPTGTAVSAQSGKVVASGTETFTGTQVSAEAQRAAVTGAETFAGTTVAAQSETCNAAGAETISGTANPSEAQTTTASAGITGTAAQAQGQGSVAAASLTIAGTLTSAESQTSADAGTETITGAATSAESQTVAALGTELVTGVDVQGEAETEAAVGGETFTGTLTSGEGQTTVGSAGASMSGTATQGQGQTEAAMGVEVIGGADAAAQAQTVDAAGALSLTGTVISGEAQTVDAQYVPAITGTAQTGESQTVAGFDTAAILQTGGAGYISPWKYFDERPIQRLPPRKITGRAQSAQSAHTRATGEATSVLIQGSGVSPSTQTSVCSGIVDNRKPINLNRARILVALMKADA